jgi:hypothetical protein
LKDRFRHIFLSDIFLFSDSRLRMDQYRER